MMVATALLQRAAAKREFLGRDQHVGCPAAQVDAQTVARLHECEAAVGSTRGRGIKNRWRAARARLAAVSDAGKAVYALPDQIGWRTHVHDFRRPGVADRPYAA